ncbi:hypothetical protein NC652_008916 [Populus alba x Populus x berolinensis]|nr:hypothetical protein NC652_008916 [Populus alba x Populus x berolinensis]
MAFTSISSMSIKSPNISTPPCILSLSKPFRIAYQLDTERGNQFAAISFSSCNLPAVADLNRFEAETRGEFGIGSAAQFGSADLRCKYLFYCKGWMRYLVIRDKGAKGNHIFPLAP